MIYNFNIGAISPPIDKSKYIATKFSINKF